MRSHKAPSFALNDPAMALATLFRPLPKRLAGERPKLDITQVFDGTSLRWRGPDTLSIQDQTVWLSLIALAAMNKAALPRTATTEVAATLRTALQLNGWVVNEDVALVTCNWRELARASGMAGSGGRSLKQLRESVRRLAEVTVWCESERLTTSSRLLSWFLGDNQCVQIALNWRVARVLFQGAQYARLCLEERRTLSTDVAKALHAWLSAALRQGRSWRYALDTLTQHVFFDPGTGATGRDRRRKVRQALDEIARLPGWLCVECRGVVTITRHPREIGHGARDNNHDGVIPTPCIYGHSHASATVAPRGSTNRVDGSPSDGGPRRLQPPPVPLPRSPRMGGETAQAPGQ